MSESEVEARAATIRATVEGRVNGGFRCPRCGMRNKTQAEATACCEGLGPSATELVSESRYRDAR